MPDEQLNAAAGLLSLKVQLDVLAEMVGKDIAERKGQDHWSLLSAEMGNKYREGLEKILLSIGDTNPPLAEALQKILDETDRG